MSKRKLVSLDEVSEAVRGSSHKKGKVLDFGKKNSRIAFDGNDLVLDLKGGKEYTITPSGVENMVRALDLPPVLPKKVEGDILGPFLTSVAAKKGTMLHPIMRGRSVVSFMENGLTTVSNDQVMDAIEKRLKDPMFDSVSVHPDGKTYMTVVSTGGKSLNVNKGDRFNSGVRITNNPVVPKTANIESFLERLVCLNGATAPMAIWRAPAVINGDVEGWLDDSIKKAVVEARVIFKSIKALTEKKITAELDDFLEGLYDTLKIPVKVRESITRRILKEGADTMYDIYNHITYVTSNYASVRDDERLQGNLYRISGHLAQHVDEVCAACHRPTFASVR